MNNKWQIYILLKSVFLWYIELCRSRKQGVISTFTFRSKHGITHCFFLSPLIPKQLSCTPQSCLMSIVDNLQFEIIDFWVTDVDEGIIWETSKFGQCRLVIKSIKLLSLITLSWVNKLISSSNRFWHYCWKKLLSTYKINK